MAWPGAMLYLEEDCSIQQTLHISIALAFGIHDFGLLGPPWIEFDYYCKEKAIVATPHMWHTCRCMYWWEQIYVACSRMCGRNLLTSDTKYYYSKWQCFREIHLWPWPLPKQQTVCSRISDQRWFDMLCCGHWYFTIVFFFRYNETNRTSQWR